MDPKFVISHNGPIGSKGQQHTAAAFFARKSAVNKGQNTATNATMTSMQQNNKPPEVNHVSNFAGILGKCPPPAPSGLLKKLNDEPSGGGTSQHGKVRVVLRVANSGVLDPERPANFRMDQKKRQVTLIDPTHSKEDSKVIICF